jgi:hypothetical protein
MRQSAQMSNDDSLMLSSCMSRLTLLCTDH